MRITLASIVLISVLGLPVPAVAATTGGAAAVGTTAVGGATPAGFNICAMFPLLPWCPNR